MVESRNVLFIIVFFGNFYFLASSINKDNMKHMIKQRGKSVKLIWKVLLSIKWIILWGFIKSIIKPTNGINNEPIMTDAILVIPKAIPDILGVESSEDKA